MARGHTPIDPQVIGRLLWAVVLTDEGFHLVPLLVAELGLPAGLAASTHGLLICPGVGVILEVSIRVLVALQFPGDGRVGSVHDPANFTVRFSQGVQSDHGLSLADTQVYIRTHWHS